jgi:hypothetical protein
MQPLAAPSAQETSVKSPRIEQSGKPATIAEEQTPALKWRVHLLSEQPAKLVGVAAAALLAAACALVLFHNVLFCLIAAALILFSVSEYLFPLTYTLASEGAKVSCGPAEWLAMSWETVQSSYRTSYGIKLSPFKNPKTARMENCRGIRLRIPPERLTEVETMIASHITSRLEGKT